MTSPIYWHPLLYHLLMRLLYGKGFLDRYAALAQRIPDGASVLELCAGDCLLYRKFLFRKRITYLATDINSVFIAAAQRRGISMARLDAARDPLPVTDIIVMQASLYQFIPHHKEIVDKMLASGRTSVILAEPVKNLSDSKNPIIAWLARHNANPGSGTKPARFNLNTLAAFIAAHYQGKLLETRMIAGGREMLVVLDARD